MIKILQLAALTVVISVFFTGCVTMPTPASKVTGSYTSELKYESFDCSKLYVELDSLTKQESRLAVAQEQRRKTSQIQAFWTGYGPPDGIEAYRLAKVRGEKDAVRRAMEARKCDALTTPGTGPQADEPAGIIIGYRLVEGKKDASGNPVFIPIYADKPNKQVVSPE